MNGVMNTMTIVLMNVIIYECNWNTIRNVTINAGMIRIRTQL